MQIKQKSWFFGFDRTSKDLKFSYGTADIEIVKEFNYLGIVFTKTCNFSMAKNYFADKALRAMYELLKLGRLYKLPISIQIDLFHKMVKPILLYGCEVIGCGNNDVFERVH